MLNRRHLRIKVLQALYAWFRSSGDSPAAAQKGLLTSIDRIWHLYIAYLSFFHPLLNEARRRMDERKNKRLPTAEDLDPNEAFVEDPVLKVLANSEKITTEAKAQHVDSAALVGLSRKVFEAIAKSERYEAFMATAPHDASSSRSFLVSIFKKHVANSELLLGHFDDISIHWSDDVDLVANAVVKTIKKVDPTQGDLELLPFFKDARSDKQFVKDLFQKTITLSEENELLIDKHADGWELERIAMMDMLLMKMALAEVQTFSDIPVKVTLNEYIEISKFYSTPKSDKFINGILDKAFAQLKEEGKVKKMGRGLLEH